MEIREINILDFILAFIFLTPATIIITRLYSLDIAPLLDRTIIAIILFISLMIGSYFVYKIFRFITNWKKIIDAIEMNTEGTVVKSFLKTNLTVEELVDSNFSYERNYDGFEVERSRNVFEKIAMSTERDIAPNINHVEIKIFRDTYIIKTKMTNRELRQNNMFKVGQNYKIYEYHKNFFLEKNRIIYLLIKGSLDINDYNNWLTCNEI